MIIGKAEVQRVRYFPERLLGTSVFTIGANGQASPAPLDVRLFEPLLLRVVDLSLGQNSNIEWELAWDQKRLRRTAGAVSTTEDEPLDIPAFRQLQLSLFNVGASPVSDYPVRFGLWVYPPSLAERLHRRQTLTNADVGLAQRLSLADEIRRSRLPIPIDSLLAREVQGLERLVFTRRVNLSAGGEILLEQIRPEGPDEALVLQAIACDRGTAAANNVVLHVDRDGVPDYLTIQAWAMPGAGRLVPLWIPAIEELRIWASAQAPVSDWTARLQVARIRLSDVWKVRWGLVSRTDVPQELWEMVQGGLL